MADQKKRKEFTPLTKRKAYKRSGGQCERHRINRFECNTRFDESNKPEYHHIVSARLDGGNGLDNCAVLCPSCHLVETNKQKRATAQEVRFAKERNGERKRKRRGAKIPSRGFRKVYRKIPSRPLRHKKLRRNGSYNEDKNIR